MYILTVFIELSPVSGGRLFYLQSLVLKARSLAFCVIIGVPEQALGWLPL